MCVCVCACVRVCVCVCGGVEGWGVCLPPVANSKFFTYIHL